ncbi:MAG: G/U mismatch-specific DNA glycosylase [Chloroflexota bacterium]|nr:G/U mismatch-specific DNA glycosylase [Chloroflexota bacterium]
MPDIIGPRLVALFCGINPGLYSGAVGHHFARPGNRFWKALYGAGFTDRLLTCWEERELLSFRLGITNLVDRATAAAAELSPAELRQGASTLAGKVRRYRPVFVAVVGISAYRLAFGRPKAAPGPQPEPLGQARLWVLPQPSGLQAYYQLPALVEAFRALRQSMEQ